MDSGLGVSSVWIKSVRCCCCCVGDRVGVGKWCDAGWMDDCGDISRVENVRVPLLLEDDARLASSDASGV